MTLAEIVFVGGIMGGVPGGSLTGPVVSGLDQPYPHCNGITVMDPEAPIEEIHGTVMDVRGVRPCIGQPGYLLATVNVAGRVLSIYLGPGSFLAEQGVNIAPGDALSGYAVHAGDTVTALTIEVSGQAVTLRDEQGRPLWNRSHISH